MNDFIKTILIGITIVLSLIFSINYISTGNPLKLENPIHQCSSYLHITHENNPVENLAIKYNDGSILTTTNSTGYAHIEGCLYSVKITYNGTDYGITPQDGKIIEVNIK